MRFFIIFLLILMPLANASVKDNLEPKLTNLGENFNLAKYKIVLPLNVKVISLDTNEEFLVSLTKEGKIEFTDKTKVDITIQGNEKDLIKLIDPKNFKESINNVNIYGSSFKGKMAVLIAEKISKSKFNKTKSLSDKILGYVVYPITLLVKN
ncbi:MAG: hypothetical protein AABX61_02265 [Nanoarchaeota archaeon]